MGIIRAINILAIFLVMFSCKVKLEQDIEASWPDGTPQKVVYYDMLDGERVKVREERFYENGSQEMVGGYHGIKKEGDWIYWFQDGKKWSQASYDNDIKVGKAIVWREDGNKNYEGTYSTGRPHGTWIFYDIDGSRLKEVLFEHGEKINEITFKQAAPMQMPQGDSVQVRIE